MTRQLFTAITTRQCIAYWDDERPWLWIEESTGTCHAYAPDQEGFDLLLYALRVHCIVICPGKPYADF